MTRQCLSIFFTGVLAVSLFACDDSSPGQPLASSALTLSGKVEGAPCTPLTLRCVAGNVYLCQTTKQWEWVESCSEQGQICEKGKCVDYLIPDAADSPVEPDTTSDSVDVEISECVMTQLVDHEVWEQIALEQDPFWDGEVEPTVCDPSKSFMEVGIDTPVFSMVTADCAWITVRQPLGRNIPKGTSMNINIVRFQLDAGDGPYTLKLAVGNPPVVIWEEQIPIPQLKGGYHTGAWTAEADYDKDTPLWFHLENHDPNEWWIDVVQACL